MTTLWIFGDSFAHYTPYNIWAKQIVELTNANPQYYGEGGTSLEYTYEKFNEQRNNIQDNDIIVLALTDINRRWFLRDNLKDTIWMIMSQNNETGNAIENYLKYLNNESLFPVYLTNFMCNLEYLTKKKNTHTIVLPCFDTTLHWLISHKELFPSVHVADKSLMSISQREFEDPNLLQHYTNVVQGDLRRCHLIESNHSVMANILYNNIKNNEPLLLKGFVEGVLNKHTLTNTDFSHQELFDVHLIPEREYWDRCVSLL